MKCIRLLAAVTVLFPALSSNAQSTADPIPVAGKDCRFTITDSTGWIADTVNAAKYKANIIFYRSRQDSAKVRIEVKTFAKADSNWHVFGGFGKNDQDARITQLQHNDPQYRDYRYQKLMIYEKDTLLSIWNIDPGAKYKHIFSAVLRTVKEPRAAKDAAAVHEEYKAFFSLIASLTMKE
jgi:hypothetical protein